MPLCLVPDFHSNLPTRQGHQAIPEHPTHSLDQASLVWTLACVWYLFLYPTPVRWESQLCRWVSLNPGEAEKLGFLEETKMIFLLGLRSGMLHRRTRDAHHTAVLLPGTAELADLPTCPPCWLVSRVGLHGLHSPLHAFSVASAHSWCLPLHNFSSLEHTSLIHSINIKYLFLRGTGWLRQVLSRLKSHSRWKDRC